MFRKLLRPVLLLPVLAVVAVCADDRGESLETLLSELRELREVSRQEELQSQEEFRHLERMVQKQEHRLSEGQKVRNDLQDQVKRKAGEAEALTAATSELTKDADALRASLFNLIIALENAQHKNPLLTDDAGRKRIMTLKTGVNTMALNVLTSESIAVLLDMSNRGTLCQVSRGVILLDKQELHVDKLRIGSLAELWITSDSSRCGIGVPTEHGVGWQELPTSEIAAIKEAFTVANEDKAAEILLLPLPAGGSND